MNHPDGSKAKQQNEAKKIKKSATPQKYGQGELIST